MSFKNFKRSLGLLWMLIGPVTIILLVTGAVNNINSGLEGDINQPLPWIIIICIFTPVALGLSIFGWYVWKREFERMEEEEENNGQGTREYE